MDVNNLFGSRDIRLMILDWTRFIPDNLMLKIEYRMKIGKKLNLDSPTTFNEKLQWLKLHDRKPIYTQMADKYGVREYIERKIGKEYLVPIYGCWDSVEDIPFETLPQKFVLKCTHDSGSVILCTDKSALDIKETKKKLKKRLKKNPYWWAREWPYKNIKPKVIAEHYLIDEGHEFLPVYKFFCFNGVPKIIQQIQNDKQENETVDYFDTEWTRLNIKQRFPSSETPVKKPKQLDEMLEIAGKLAEDTCFLRVDLYIINEKILFSEHTFYTDAGYSIFEPESWDKVLGEWIDLTCVEDKMIKAERGNDL